jgi:hypothetical protein
MAENPMLKFVKIPRLMPQKRDALDRTDDFGEIYSEFSEDKACRAGEPVQPMWCAILPNSLPTAQQYPRLAAPDR